MRLLQIERYLQARQRPRGRAIARQLWRQLAFLHCDLEPEAIQATLPTGLLVDTFADARGRERAWVGLVPFWLRQERLLGAPLGWLFGRMPETNLRTYVHCEGRPGIYFYTLEAASRLFCIGARMGFGLPYRQASMSVSIEDARASYSSERLERPLPATCSLVLDVREPIGQAQPGTFEFFVIERYLLYAQRSSGLFRAQVHHQPYPLRRCEIVRCEESLGRSLGVPSAPYSHCLFSEGVDVDMFAPLGVIAR